jgi:hypothetical protein
LPEGILSVFACDGKEKRDFHGGGLGTAWVYLRNPLFSFL